MKNKIFVSGLVLIFALMTSFTALANKTSVTIEVSPTAKIGSEITITLKVEHMGNSSSHFSDWVVLKINGEVVKKWIFTKKNLPTAANFTLTYKFIVNSDLKIEAEGHCNLHGSAGIAATEVKAIK